MITSTTVMGLLPVGLNIDGQVRQKFSLRLARVGDSLTARDVYPTDDMRFRLLHIAQRLTLDGVSRALTVPDLEQLFDIDLAAIQEADEELEKKLMPRKAG